MNALVVANTTKLLESLLVPGNLPANSLPGHVTIRITKVATRIGPPVNGIESALAKLKKHALIVFQLLE